MTRKIMSQIKQCKAKWCNNTFTVYNSIQKHCSNCMIEINNQKTLKKYKPIKQKSSTNKNTVAKFTQKTKDEINDRQNWLCIISWDSIEEYHHTFYWALHANFWEDRNEHYEWVWLSAKVHYIIHHGKDTKLAKKYKLQCIEYSVKMRMKYKK